MKEFDYSLVKNPEYFKDGRMDAHSDHISYANPEEASLEETSFRHSLNGIWAAVQAGLGLTIRTRIGMPGNLRTVAGLLPSPGSLAVNLQQTPREVQHSAAVALLGDLMTEALQGWVEM